eukprot:TRINITY_DN16250_c0_g1_i2.p2 TRINITY_DN16250_c0_g1~~TRINITY_DN16250_c0_g1_i2.p2  ORF type:complete len:179 (+),score=5.60 TRINITY_DN16250_c0_g1_i2:129-665(+)
MPFYYVQIAPWHYFNNSKGIERPLLVEAQVKALSLIKNSGMATTTDLGEELCIHPSKKREVGQRLAACALEQTYKIQGMHATPLKINEIKYEKEKVYISFKDTNQSVSPGIIHGFEIAGKNKVFYEATAKASNGCVEVVSRNVKHPIAVRYGFRNYIEADMKNCTGIAVCSFRSDSWE